MGEIEFKCRICGSEKYEEERIGNILGSDGSSWVKNYVCSGCSVVFKNVNKFTKKTKK